MLLNLNDRSIRKVTISTIYGSLQAIRYLSEQTQSFRFLTGVDRGVNHMNIIISNSSYLNFHPLQAVSRYRDPQLQAGGNYPNICLICDQTFSNLDI